MAKEPIRSKSGTGASLHQERESLTQTQASVFAFIRDQFYASGSMPTLREICKQFQWKAIGSAQDIVRTLVDKGWLKKDPQKARGLSLPSAEDFKAVPLLGSAPAGVPIESIENHERDILVPSFVKGAVFAVRVVGDSMVNAGIQNEDIAIVRQTERAKERDIVVAMLQGEVTIKRFEERRGGEIWLVPENPRYQARRVDDPQFRILGKVIGLHRYWE